jgi:hypothetical protein
MPVLALANSWRRWLESFGWEHSRNWKLEAAAKHDTSHASNDG